MTVLSRKTATKKTLNWNQKNIPYLHSKKKRKENIVVNVSLFLNKIISFDVKRVSSF